MTSIRLITAALLLAGSQVASAVNPYGPGPVPGAAPYGAPMPYGPAYGGGPFGGGPFGGGPFGGPYRGGGQEHPRLARSRRAPALFWRHRYNFCRP